MKYLLKLNENKSAGPDGLHPRVLKETATELYKPLSVLFRKIYETGVLPKVWKEGTITPLFKKGKRSDPSNYRPISLTCIVVKVFETILRDHLLHHLIQNELLSNVQHGFVPKRSCITIIGN